jgi:hypothetical protein
LFRAMPNNKKNPKSRMLSVEETNAMLEREFAEQGSKAEELPPKEGESNVTSLLQIMMTEDLARAAEHRSTVTVEETGLVRRLPVISTNFVNPLSVRLKRLQETEIAQKMAPTDNPWLSALEA